MQQTKVNNVPLRSSKTGKQEALAKPLLKATALDTVNARYQALVQASQKPHSQLYGVIDAAVDKTLYGRIQNEPTSSEIISLYDGDPAIRYARYAPYLLKISPQSPLSFQWLDEGWQAHWGVFFTSPLPPSKVKRHFKKLLQVTTPQGKKAWMRFYDPRVLPKLLSSMSPSNSAAFFDTAVQTYVVPTSHPQQLLRLSLNKTSWLENITNTGNLIIETISTTQPPEPDQAHRPT